MFFIAKNRFQHLGQKKEVSVLMCIVHGLRYKKVSVQVTHPAPATAHVPISHLPPQQLCPHGA
jgi:hypothetical protein